MIKWDAPLPESLTKKWKKAIKELVLMEEIVVLRLNKKVMAIFSF